MYDRILVPTDGSNYSKKAGSQAIELAKKTNGTVIVTNIIDQLSEESYEVLEDSAKKYIQEIIDEAIKNDVKCESMIIYGSPEFDIMTLTRKSEANCIMIHTHGKDNSLELTGSFTKNVIDKINLPIILIK